MKEGCSGSGNLIPKGKVLKVKSHKLFGNPESLFVGIEGYFCECQDKWQLIKPKVKKPSKPKVCKHEYQIVVMPVGYTVNSGQEKGLLIAVCTKPDCLEKKYI